MSKRRAKRRSAPAKRKRAPRRPATSPPSAAPKEVNFATEYHYVLDDLKRIAILAAAMFGVLILLAQIIR